MLHLQILEHKQKHMQIMCLSRPQIVLDLEGNVTRYINLFTLYCQVNIMYASKY